MDIYVKDNVERIAGNAVIAKRLEMDGYKLVRAGEPVIPAAIPAPVESPSEEATKIVQKRRRNQRRAVTVTE